MVSLRQKLIYKKLIILSILALLGVFVFAFYGINSNNFDFFMPMRITKILAILIVSYCISYTAVIFQTITNNKILTPSIMGLDSLYLFIQTFVVFFYGAKKITMLSDIKGFITTVFLMVIASIFLYILLFKGRNKNIYFLILAGMVLGAFFKGLASFMQILLDPNEFLVLQGSMFASFNNINFSLLGICIAISLICFFVMLFDFKKFDILNLGEEAAINLGIDYKFLVFKSLIIISVLISISTVLVGPVTFLGILVVSISRELLKTYRHSYMSLGAFLISVISLIYALFVVEKLLNFATTVSVIINFIGGIYFIYIVLKEAKR
ncbi:iron chelate uptake ABC transporter family permease subunit [Campylobacter portucalensis]|uniref:iron chelate uptake ABC transporter family permease subunit n=1 Tax=Campylobacter portucalensis TaxID=2608384 RepID=UPI002DDA0BB9|nr:iron chelate uptake ABC transporter family permease subunit [Campylobacter portucalensis]